MRRKREERKLETRNEKRETRNEKRETRNEKMQTANKANPFPRGIPRTYSELVGVHMPKAIHDHVEFENSSEIMNALAGHELNKDQEEYLDTVSILVDEYDRTH